MSTPRIDGPTDAVFGPPIELQAWAGSRIDLEVDPRCTALVVHDDTVRGIFLGGAHPVHVLAPDEEPGDIDNRTFATRMKADLEDLSYLRPRTRQIPSEARLRFVAVDVPVFVEFGQNGPAIFRDATRGDVEIAIEGVARLSVIDPVRFHASFLHTTEDLEPADFEAILGSLVEAGLVRTMEAGTDDVEAIEPDPSTLAARAVASLRTELAAVGMDVEALDVTRLELPTGSATGSATARPAAPAPLATPRDPR